ncbi:ArnT family glycosyltransferase [Acetobacter conturbans]|uniref:Glycosyltransferase RgtA/B/C/D-like domain-containing protein n=1 Tax=Acetobacter conturbans TaxID=1737472 RepID=A0ABX0JVE7_9PROT|nr:glycosyltransferase family 39 protein [Acetobacter conturbans]NHN87481.1 hypothetical protein [Acetobacter conturbans]
MLKLTSCKEGSSFLIPALLLCFAVLCRFQLFGDPLGHIDEQFYLFVGGRMLHGDLPFVQLWDRKPIGLFLLYAFFHLFGPYRIWAYQIFGLLSVWGTSLLLVKMARLFAPLGGAVIAGMIYIAWLDLSGGEGGQAPVFYNLLVAAAMAHCLFGTIIPQDGGKRIRSVGLGSMALFGIALQIKYTVVFEGIFLGLFLLWHDSRTGRSLKTIVTDGLLWAGTALVPTLLVVGFYMLKGYGHEWFFANVQSIFLRAPHPASETHLAMMDLLKRQIPLVFTGLLALLTLSPDVRKSVQTRFLVLWAVVAWFGVAIFGDWYSHYALPTFAPLAIVTAPLWNRRAGQIWLALLLLTGTIMGEKKVNQHIRKWGNAHVFKALKTTLTSPPGCVFVYRGPIAIYDAISWCPLTDHPFPGHFHEAVEDRATGIDPVHELSQILAREPLYIVSDASAGDFENMRARTYLDDALKQDYHEVYRYVPPTHKRHDPKLDSEIIIVFKRNTAPGQAILSSPETMKAQ